METANGMTKSQLKIIEVCDSMKDLLLYKNEKYGDSALHPNNIFYKGDSTNSIKIRLDDKIGRIKNCKDTRVNDVADLIGYCVLLLVSMDVPKNEIEILKDWKMKILFYMLMFILFSFWLALVIAVGSKAGLKSFFRDFHNGGKKDGSVWTE